MMFIWFDVLYTRTQEFYQEKKCELSYQLSRDKEATAASKTSPIFVWWFIIITIIYYQQMSLQHFKLQPLFYLKSKNRSYLTKNSNLEHKWEQNSSPITWAEYDRRDGQWEKHKSVKGEL